MNIDNTVRHRLNLEPRRSKLQARLIDYAGAFMAGFGFGMIWGMIYLWRIGVFS